MEKYMNTSGLSRYLGINEKKIYTLITKKRLPATKVTGKWIFPKNLVDAWIEDNVENRPRRTRRTEGVLMIAGSNDPLLELIIGEIKRTNPGFFPFLCTTGSLGGLSMLKNGKAHLSTSHLLDPERDEYNIPFIDSYLSDDGFMAVNFAYRQQGLLINHQRPVKIRGVEDLKFPYIKMINRQKGSGTRVLLDTYLERLGILASRIKGYKNEVTTHMEVGFSILKGVADVGLGIRAVADILGLDFIPLKKERFDILIHREDFFLKEVQMFIEVLRSSQFKKRSSQLGGYDVSDSGKIIYK